MNTSYKCNCCCKEDVCKYKTEYMNDCARINNTIKASLITEVSIKCKRFMPHTTTKRGIAADFD